MSSKNQLKIIIQNYYYPSEGIRFLLLLLLFIPSRLFYPKDAIYDYYLIS